MTEIGFSRYFRFKHFPETRTSSHHAHALLSPRTRTRTALTNGNDFQPKFSLQIISGDTQREKEREKGLTRERRTHEPTNGEPTNPRAHEQRTHDPRTANPRTANPRPTNGEPMNPRSEPEPTNRESHRYRSCSCDFDFLLSAFDL